MGTMMVSVVRPCLLPLPKATGCLMSMGAESGLSVQAES